jgi:predicted RNA-binding protein with RPS1 domain
MVEIRNIMRVSGQFGAPRSVRVVVRRFAGHNQGVDLAGASLPDEPDTPAEAVRADGATEPYMEPVPDLDPAPTSIVDPESTADPEPTPDVDATADEAADAEPVVVADEAVSDESADAEPDVVAEPVADEAVVDEVMADAEPTVEGSGDESHAPPIPGPGEPRVVHRPKIVTVEVTAVGPDRVEVKLADGRVGAIQAADFGTGRAPAVGAEIDAALLARSDPKRVWLSRSWARLAAAKDEKRTIPATVLRLVKGGAVADVEGQRAFLPTSLADDHAVDLSTLVGTIVDVTIIDLDEAADRVVVSRRDALRRQRRQEQRNVLGALAVGQRTTGTVLSLRDFGVQVDLGGGIRGLVHRTELSWNRVGSMTQLVKVGDQVEAVVTEVQKGKRRVSLSMRQTTPDPMLAVEMGAVSQAEITRIVEYGAFARLEDSSIEGLIHQSELSELPGARADELVAPGDVVWVKVIDIDVPRRRLGLSVRQALLS